jgi:hypothetical protein
VLYVTAVTYSTHSRHNTVMFKTLQASPSPALGQEQEPQGVASWFLSTLRWRHRRRPHLQPHTLGLRSQTPLPARRRPVRESPIRWMHYWCYMRRPSDIASYVIPLMITTNECYIERPSLTDTMVHVRFLMTDDLVTGSHNPMSAIRDGRHV